MRKKINALDTKKYEIRIRLKMLFLDETPEMVRLLVRKGANTNRKDRNGRLPITYLRVNDMYYREKLSALNKN